MFRNIYIRELYEQQASHFFWQEFSSTKTPSKFLDILRLMSNLDGISCLIYNNIPPPWQSLSTLYGVVKPSISNWASGKELSILVSVCNRIYVELTNFYSVHIFPRNASQQGRKIFNGVTNFSWFKFVTFLRYLTRVFIHYLLISALFVMALSLQNSKFLLLIFSISFLLLAS